MSNYIKQLEEQNEQLKDTLAELQVEHEICSDSNKKLNRENDVFERLMVARWETIKYEGGTAHLYRNATADLALITRDKKPNPNGDTRRWRVHHHCISTKVVVTMHQKLEDAKKDIEAIYECRLNEAMINARLSLVKKDVDP